MVAFPDRGRSRPDTAGIAMPRLFWNKDVNATPAIHRLRATVPGDATAMAQPTILVFDSGLGGLTVFREVAAARPDASFVYAADDAFFPYAAHGEADLVARVVPLLGE